MMLTLIPFFDRNMSVSAYSLFTRKNNFLMNPSLLGSRQFDGAAYVDGLELIQELGTTTLSGGKPIFVSLNNISIFSSLESECKNTNHAPILLIDQTFPPVSMYTDRIRELREFGYHFAMRNLPVHCYEDYAPILPENRCRQGFFLFPQTVSGYLYLCQQHSGHGNIRKTQSCRNNFFI